MIELPSNTTKKMACKQCGFTYYGKDVDIAFRPVFANHGSQNYLRPVCKLCDQDNRTGKVQKDRWLAKAIKTRLNHSKSLGIPVSKLETSLGWIPVIMGHEAEHNYTNGCSECHHPYELMGHGLRDITLDIWDPRVEPVYGSNTRWICSTCNSAKGDMTPEEWTTYKRLWRERENFLTAQAITLKPKQLSFAF